MCYEKYMCMHACNLNEYGQHVFITRIHKKTIYFLFMMNIDSALTLGLWDVWRQIFLTNVTCMLVRWDFKLFKMKLWKLILRIKLSKMKPMT